MNETMYEKFENITGYDIKSFFQSFVDFVSTEYPYIVDYYQGGSIRQESFYALDRLTKEVNKIEPLFTLHKNSLNDLDAWELLDTFTEIQTKILTIRSSAKWMRSVFDYVRTNTIKVEKILQSDETFEDVSANLDAMTPQDDWVNITVPQYITEELYTNSSSPIFSVNLQNVGLNYVDNVVDVLNGKSILGVDLDKSFTFENDDLKVIEYDQAMVQALELIQSSLKGSYPEFEDYGITNEFIGTTVNAIQYATIFKGLMNMFQRDSRWKTVELLDLKRDQDSVFLSIRATTISANSYIINIPI